MFLFFSEHWILCYSRLDPLDCNDLPDIVPDFDLSKVTPDVVHLKDDELEYLNQICRTVLAKKVSEMGSGFSTVLKHVPYEPLHRYEDMFTKQDVFVEALEPLNEMDPRRHGTDAEHVSDNGSTTFEHTVGL